MATYDLSDLGATEHYDLSDLGGMENSPKRTFLHSAFIDNPKRLGGDVLAGMANAGNNFNHFVLDKIPSVLGVNPSSILPDRNTDYSQTFGIQDPSLFDKVVQGVSGYVPFAPLGEVGLAEKSVAALPDILSAGKSFLMKGIPGLEQAIPGAAYGATQSQPGDQISGALTGAAANMAVPQLVKGGTKLFQKAGEGIKGYLSQYAVPGLFKPISERLQSLKGIDNNQAFELAKKNYDQYSSREKTAWDSLKNIVSDLDRYHTSVPKNENTGNLVVEKKSNTSISSPFQFSQFDYALGNQGLSTNPLNYQRRITSNVNASEIEPEVIMADKNINQDPSVLGRTIQGTYNKYPFDNSSYIKDLKNRANFLKDQSDRQSGFRRSNSDAISLLNDYQKDTHNTFSNAIEHNQALNKDYENEITPGKSAPFSAINFAISSLKDSIEENIDRHNLDSQLGVPWDLANQLTKDKQKLFHELISPKGKGQYSSFSTFLNGKNEFSNPGDFIKDYLPKSGDTGTQRMQQLSKMLGDENYAKSVIKRNYFANSFNDTGDIDAKSFLNNYNKLSDSQKNYLFSADENKSIQSINSIVRKYPNASPSQLPSLIGHSIPAVAGFAAAPYMGINHAEGGLLGALATPALKTLLGGTLSRPSAANYFKQLLTKQTSPFNPVIQQYLSQGASAGAVPLSRHYFIGGNNGT